MSSRDEALRALVGTWREKEQENARRADSEPSGLHRARLEERADMCGRHADELDAVLAATPDEGQRPHLDDYYFGMRAFALWRQDLNPPSQFSHSDGVAFEQILREVSQPSNEPEATLRSRAERIIRDRLSGDRFIDYDEVSDVLRGLIGTAKP